MALSYLDAQKKTFLSEALIFGLLYLIAMVICSLSIKERSHCRPAIQTPLLSSLYRSLGNPAFRPLLCAWALDGLALSILTTLFPFFVRYVIVSDGAVAHKLGQGMDPLVCISACMVAFLLGAILATWPWLKIAHRVGRYRSWIFAHILSLLTNFLFLAIQEGKTWLAIGIMFLNGLPVSAQFLTSSVLADVIDYDEFLNGARSEGSFSVFATIIPKFMSIPGSAYPLAMIYALGFRPPVNGVSQQQPAFVRIYIRLLFVFIPILLAALGFLCKALFPLKDEQTLDRIQEGIVRHLKGKTAIDPLTGREVALLDFSEEEYKIIRPFECFSVRRVSQMIQRRNADFSRLEMALYFVISATASGSLCIAVALFFPLIEDRRLSVVPVTCVLLVGIALLVTMLNLSKLMAITKLQDFDFSAHGQLLARYIQKEFPESLDIIQCEMAKL